MGLLRGDEVDARVVMLGVIPVEVPGEVGHGLAIIQEAPRVFRGALGGAEGRLDEGLSFGVRGRENNCGMPWSSQSR